MQGYRPENFGILTNAVGGKWLINRALRGIPILGVIVRKDRKAGLTGPSLKKPDIPT